MPYLSQTFFELVLPHIIICMKHFNFKSLSFYGVMICSVLLLFKIVTNYGENKLNAPLPLKKSYRLIFGEKLPDCNQPDKIILNINQSGVYLNGFLVPTNINSQQTSIEEQHPTLSGKYKNKNITLSGQVPNSVLCSNGNSENQKGYKTVNLQMQAEKQDNLSGQMTVIGMNKLIKFSAIPEQEQNSSIKSNHH
ncbi:hypothetical protein [Fischerella sp. JS2]|uniref:hypothetical protein n=1 Tax=Fischerella sp. JS2 TaxID=2597771 RepID=UPI0028E60440|nr:hypothetical protein [Fischerella sp. JS2]